MVVEEYYYSREMHRMRWCLYTRQTGYGQNVERMVIYIGDK